VSINVLHYILLNIQIFLKRQRDSFEHFSCSLSLDQPAVWEAQQENIQVLVL